MWTAVKTAENTVKFISVLKTIVWPTFYVNNGDVTAFCGRYFNSFHKNEFIQRSRKTKGQLGKMKTIICVVEF